MKTEIILKIALSIALLIGVYFLYSWLNKKDKDYKSEIETVNNELSDLKQKYDVIEQSDLKQKIVTDSLSESLVIEKLKNTKITNEIKILKSKKDEKLEVVKNLSDSLSVKYFITNTGGLYDILMFDGYYLISLSSIKSANNFLVNEHYLYKENKLLNTKIYGLENQVRISAQNFISQGIELRNANSKLDNRNEVIANMNIKIALNDSYNKKLKSQRDLIGLAAILVVILK